MGLIGFEGIKNFVMVWTFDIKTFDIRSTSRVRDISRDTLIPTRVN